MTQDEQNLDLLSIFHYVVGGLAAFCSCFFLIYVAIGIAMLCGAMDGKDAPPEFMGWFFVGLGGVFVLVGWTVAAFIIAAGRKLKRRRSYTFCMVIAGIECIFMPLGTALGVFSLIVLTKAPVKALFNPVQVVPTPMP